MPTTRPRHTITETERVEAALARLRNELRGAHIDFAELVVLGAEEKVARLRRDGPSSSEARSWLARRIRDRTLPSDIAAADEVKTLGLQPRRDDAPDAAA